MKFISSRQNPLVRRYQRLARDRRPGNKLILLEGRTLIEEAAAAGLKIVEAAVSRDAYDRPADARLARMLTDAGFAVVGVSDSVLHAISPSRSPSGWMAIAERTTTRPEALFTRQPSLVVALVDVQDPGNVGAVVRAAEAGGATGVAVCGASADPFGWKALRGAMGSVFRLTVDRRADARAVVDDARAAGLAVVATVARGGIPYTDLNLRRPTLLLAGSEGSGLTQDLVKDADDRATIPMEAPAESLNVAVATAVILFEARRQRSSEG